LNPKPLLLAALFTLLIAPLSSAQEILSAEKFFDGVSADYGKVADYTAAITITAGKNGAWRGRISYKSPLFLRIDFDDPKGQVFVIDAEKLTIYVPGLDVVLVQRYKKKSSAEIASMASRQGLNILRSSYGIAFYAFPGFVPLEDGSKEQVMKLKLTPKSSGAAFSQIIMSVGKDNLIRRMEATEASGDKLVLDLSNIKTNQNIPDARFQYDSPPYANIQDDFLFDSSE
jgi:outer membrane lipoprotein-sorting protein